MDKATDLVLVIITVAGAILALVVQKIGRTKLRSARNTNCNSNCGCIKSSAASATALHPIKPAVTGEPRRSR